MSDNNQKKEQDVKALEKAEAKTDSEPVETPKSTQVQTPVQEVSKPIQPVTINTQMKPLEAKPAQTARPVSAPPRKNLTNVDKLNNLLNQINELLPDKTTIERYGYHTENGVALLRRIYEFVSQTNDSKVYDALLAFFIREINAKASQQVLLAGCHRLTDRNMRSRLSTFYTTFNMLAAAKKYNNPFNLDINCINRFIVNPALIRWLTIQKAGN